jgi:hypothetical protein
LPNVNRQGLIAWPCYGSFNFVIDERRSGFSQNIFNAAPTNLVFFQPPRPVPNRRADVHTSITVLGEHKVAVDQTWINQPAAQFV